MGGGSSSFVWTGQNPLELQSYISKKDTVTFCIRNFLEGYSIVSSLHA
jgi:hypothetical protein